MKRTAAFWTGVVVWALVASSVMALDANGPTWRPREFITSNVFIPGHFGADRVLEYDHWGNPGVAIDCIEPDPQNQFEYVSYWRRSALGWQSQIVDWRWLEPADMGMYPSLAYDRYERPSISYYNNNIPRTFQMHYAHWDANSGWVISFDADPIPPVGKYTCLAYDVYGRAGVSYQSSHPHLKYAYDANMDFRIDPPVEVQFACTAYLCGETTTLAYDHVNRPWIAHVGMLPDGGGNALLLTMDDPGIGWRTAIIDNNVRNSGLSMAINPRTGQPAVVYQRADSNLVYQEFDGNYWYEHVISLDGYYAQGGYEPSLAFDPTDGNPAVAYVNFQQDLVFSWFDGSAWNLQRVDGNGWFDNPSLAFNEYGTGWPGIVYFDSDGVAYFVEDPQGIPEPASLVCLTAGAAALFRRRRRR